MVALLQCGHHRLLVWEVLVQGADAHARPLGDAVCRGAFEALGLQNVSSGEQNRVNRRPGARLARLFPWRDGHFARHRTSFAKASRGRCAHARQLYHAPRGEERWKTHGLNHIHLHVRDLAKSLRFYGAFGFEKVASHEDISFLVRPGFSDIIALHASGMHGIDHFGFILKDAAQLDEAITELERCGGRLIERTTLPLGTDSAFLTDPDGYHVQI